MVDLVQVVRREAPLAGLHYAVLHGAPHSLSPVLKRRSILAAIIKHDDEELPQQWKADLGGVWKPDFYLPGGHELKLLSHKLTIYNQPKPSRSEDSDHRYLGYNEDLGLLLQCANSEPWRTHDCVGHSSAHNGHDEAFYALHGSAEIWLDELGKEPVRAQLGTGYTKGGTGFKEDRVVVVTSGMWHPVVAPRGPALILIHGPPEMVADQVNGTSLCHKNGTLFREMYADVLRHVSALKTP